MQGFYPALQRTFSTARLAAYHDGDPSPVNLEVAARYAHNLSVSMRLSPALHILEVALRNNIHNALSSRYASLHWFDVRGALGPKQSMQIGVARGSLAAAGKAETADRLVAELTMGFWVGLFGAYYEVFWRSSPGALREVFPHAPRHLRQRAVISGLLQPLRVLRNRVSHWERIAHLPHLLQRKTDIDNLVRALCPAASRLLVQCDPFHGAIAPEEFEIARDKVRPCFDPTEIQVL